MAAAAAAATNTATSRTVLAGCRTLTGTFALRLVSETISLQNVGPFPAFAAVTVLKMLPKMIGAVKLFAEVALAEPVLAGEMRKPFTPVDFGIGEFLTAEAAGIVR